MSHLQEDHAHTATSELSLQANLDDVVSSDQISMVTVPPATNGATSIDDHDVPARAGGDDDGKAMATSSLADDDAVPSNRADAGDDADGGAYGFAARLMVSSALAAFRTPGAANPYGITIDGVPAAASTIRKPRAFSSDETPGEIIAGGLEPRGSGIASPAAYTTDHTGGGGQGHERQVSTASTGNSGLLVSAWSSVGSTTPRQQQQQQHTRAPSLIPAAKHAVGKAAMRFPLPDPGGMPALNADEDASTTLSPQGPHHSKGSSIFLSANDKAQATADARSGVILVSPMGSQVEQHAAAAAQQLHHLDIGSSLLPPDEDEAGPIWNLLRRQESAAATTSSGLSAPSGTTADDDADDAFSPSTKLEPDHRLLGAIRFVLYAAGILAIPWFRLSTLLRLLRVPAQSKWRNRLVRGAHFAICNLHCALVLFMLIFCLLREIIVPYYRYEAERVAWVSLTCTPVVLWIMCVQVVRRSGMLHRSVAALHKQCYSYNRFRAKYTSAMLPVRALQGHGPKPSDSATSTTISGISPLPEAELSPLSHHTSVSQGPGLATREIRTVSAMREDWEAEDDAGLGVTAPFALPRGMDRQLELPPVEQEVRYVSRLSRSLTAGILLFTFIIDLPLALLQMGYQPLTRGNSDLGEWDRDMAHRTAYLYYVFFIAGGVVRVFISMIAPAILAMMVHLLYWRAKRLMDVVKTVELFELPVEMLPWLALMRQRIIDHSGQTARKFFPAFVMASAFVSMNGGILLLLLMSSRGEHPHTAHFAAAFACMALLALLYTACQKLVNAEYRLTRRLNLLLQRGYARLAPPSAFDVRVDGGGAHLVTPAAAASTSSPMGRFRSASAVPADTTVAEITMNPVQVSRMLADRARAPLATSTAATVSRGDDLNRDIAAGPSLKRVNADQVLQGHSKEYTAGEALLDSSAAVTERLIQDIDRDKAFKRQQKTPRSGHVDLPAAPVRTLSLSSAPAVHPVGSAGPVPPLPPLPRGYGAAGSYGTDGHDDGATTAASSAALPASSAGSSTASTNSVKPISTSPSHSPRDGAVELLHRLQSSSPRSGSPGAGRKTEGDIQLAHLRPASPSGAGAGADDPSGAVLFVKRGKRTGVAIIKLIRSLYARQLKEVAVFATLWLSVLIFRSYVAYPKCNNLLGSRGYCSDAVEIGRLIETCTLSHCQYTLFLASVAYVFGGRQFAASLKWMYALTTLSFFAITLGIRINAFNEHDPGWWDVHTNLTNLFGLMWICYKLSFTPAYSARPSPAWMLVPVFLLAVVYNTVQTYAITELYANATPRERVVVVLAYQPLVTQTLLVAAEFLCHRMFKMVPGLGDRPFYYPVMALQALMSMIGRMYLSNLKNLGDQIITAVLLMLVELSIRITRPLRTYVMWRTVSSHDEALRRARDYHTVTIRRHAEYIDQFTQVSSIIVATLFSAVVRAQYDVPQSGELVFGSLLVQLVIAVIGDLCSILAQCWYLDMTLDLWYRHQRAGLYLRTFLYTLTLAPLFTKDSIQIVLASSGVTAQS